MVQNKKKQANLKLYIIPGLAAYPAKELVFCSQAWFLLAQRVQHAGCIGGIYARITGKGSQRDR